MRIHRFYIKQEGFTWYNTHEQFEIRDNEMIHQLKDVFRFEGGDIINVFDGEECELQCKIVELSKKKVDLEIIKILKSEEILLQTKNITLAFALLKGEHTEMVLEKCTELGVTTFQPLITDRTVKTGFRRERLEKIIKESTEQSGFVNLPKLLEPANIEDFLKVSKSTSKVFVMDMLGDRLPTLTTPHNEGEVVLLIGPEGGWSDDERKLFKELSLKTFSLGPQTLRAETACIGTISKFL